MKSDKSYSMSKPTKTYLNMLMNDEKRSEHKELFVEAEFHSSNIKRRMSTAKVITETDDE
jgi:hypothetical protein